MIADFINGRYKGGWLWRQGGGWYPADARERGERKVSTKAGGTKA